MNRTRRRPLRSRLSNFLMVAAPLLAVLGSLLVIAVWPGQPEAQAEAQRDMAMRVRAAAPYVSSDPSLPVPGTFTLPAEASVQVEAF